MGLRYEYHPAFADKGGNIGNFNPAVARSGELIYTNAFYYIGHFSKFIKPGAKRISSAASRSQLLTTAFRNPDGTVAVVVMNQGDMPTSYFLWINGQAAEIKSRPHSIATLLI